VKKAAEGAGGRRAGYFRRKGITTPTQSAPALGQPAGNARSGQCWMLGNSDSRLTEIRTAATFLPAERIVSKRRQSLDQCI
jgi:hypothetical protein